MSECKTSATAEMRRYIEGCWVPAGVREKLEAIADRIDAEYIMLPAGKDGVNIRMGDAVYGAGCGERRVCGFDFTIEHGWKLWLEGDYDYAYVRAEDVTHGLPDSFERIAAEIEESDVDGCTDLADRIRKLAKEAER